MQHLRHHGSTPYLQTFYRKRAAAQRTAAAATLFPPTFETAGCGPHQFRTRNGLIKTQRMRSNANENAGKSTNVYFIPPLITVWLQVLVLPGPPMLSSIYRCLLCDREQPPHQLWQRVPVLARSAGNTNVIDENSKDLFASCRKIEKRSEQKC
jgi:hypothetical protein